MKFSRAHTTILRILLFIGFTMVSILGFAQDAAEGSSAGGGYYPKLGLYLVAGITLAVVAFTLSVLFGLINDLLRQKDSTTEIADIESEVAASEQGASFIKSIYNRLTEAVPVEREDEVLLDHNYDGIKELDNRLPPWWLGLFYGSIAFAVFYIGYFHVAGKGLSSAEAWEQEVEVAQAQVDRFLASQSAVVDENTVTILTDQAALDAGELTFGSLCATCHLVNGAGLVGPNLTDEYWLHGGDIKDVFRVIKYGVPEKGMISWASQLRPAQMQEVASYILHSLVGTNPPNPKEPQGERYQRETD